MGISIIKLSKNLCPKEDIVDCKENFLSLQHISQLGWFFDPSDRSILTFRPNQQPILMTNSDRLITQETINLELIVENGRASLLMTKQPRMLAQNSVLLAALTLVGKPLIFAALYET